MLHCPIIGEGELRANTMLVTIWVMRRLSRPHADKAVTNDANQVNGYLALYNRRLIRSTQHHAAIRRLFHHDCVPCLDTLPPPALPSCEQPSRRTNIIGSNTSLLTLGGVFYLNFSKDYLNPGAQRVNSSRLIMLGRKQQVLISSYIVRVAHSTFVILCSRKSFPKNLL